MTTGDFWLAGGNLPFAFAGGLILAVLAFELVALLLGGSVAGLLDGASDADADVDFPALQWVGIGIIPAFALGVVWLALFSLSGYAIQATVLRANGTLMAPVVAGVLALIPTLLLSGPISRYLGRTLFKDETDALSADDLLGGTATITLGATYAGHPTQAKIVDRHHTTHYVLVEPLNPEARFDSGAAVTLVQRDGAKYFIVGEGSDALFDSLATPKI